MIISRKFSDPLIIGIAIVFIILLRLTFSSSVTQAQTTIYVDVDATGANDGSSWNDAYTDLQDALGTASGSNEIWIAKGIYTPHTDPEEPFLISENEDGLKIYGGFVGDETSRSQRNPDDHRTVLSGDIGGDDNTNAHGVTETAADINGTDNVTVLDITAVSSGTIIDGVTITGGDAGESSGGGINLNDKAAPTINNVTFAGNSAGEGGALYIEGAASNGGVQIRRSTFRNNAALQGGAVYIDGVSKATPVIDKSVFIDNSATINTSPELYYSGGAIHMNQNSNPTIFNSIFIANSVVKDPDAAAQISSAIGLYVPTGHEARPTIVNSTFLDQKGIVINGRLLNGNGLKDVTVKNSIFYNENVTADFDLYVGQITHSLVEGGDGSITAVESSNIIVANPQFVDAGDPDGPDQTFGTADDGLRLTSVSSAIDAGDNAAVPGDISTDVTGTMRIQSGTVDMGAYEGGVPDPALTYHVDAGAGSDSNDGQSWGEAFVTLNEALSTATVNDQIWIAEGVYTPGSSEGDSFTITGAQDGLKIYGGFENGDAFVDRNPADHPVVLSGDIEDNDNTNANGVTPTAADISGANSDRILFIDGITRGPITGATVLDGVTISGANGGVGAGLFCDGESSSQSGGIECSPTLANLIFAGNHSTGDGAALYNDGSDFGVANPDLTNVLFTGNAADSDGGAIYNNGRSAGEASPTLTNVTLAGNEATDRGGALYNDGTEGAASPDLTNVLFTGNTAGSDGGAIYNYGRSHGEATPTLTNVTLAGNEATESGGAIYNNTPNLGNTRPIFTNMLIWENTSGSGGPIHDVASPTFHYSLVEGLNPGGTNLDGTNPVNDPLFADPSDPEGTDDRFGTGDDGLALQPGSPAIDAGDNNAIPGEISTDMAGSARTHNGIVDIGAYEATETRTPIHVDVEATGANNGTSWNDAYTSLQSALSTAAGVDEIWIAEGTYTPGTDRGDRFTITGAQDGLRIYGGFAGTETLLSQRSPADHPVVLSGDIGAAGNASDNSYHVLVFDGTTGGTITNVTQLAGVTVTRGNADGASPDNRGGGLYCIGSNSGNECSPQIKNVVFSNNSAATGGAIYSFGDSGVSSPAIINSLFIGNSATVRGGAVQTNGNNSGTSNPSIVNCTFTNNSTTGEGGAINNSAVNGGTSATQITNTILWGNQADNGGSEIFNIESTPVLSHTLIDGGVNGSGSGGSTSTDDGGNVNADPLFANAADPDGADNIFATADDGLRLQGVSPAVNAGDNAAISKRISTDVINAVRIQAGTVNMGAYEGTVMRTPIHVDAEATGANDGTSWGNAYTSLQSALNAAAGIDQIWIAEGVYTPGSSEGDSFTITGAQNGLKIYGGFESGDTFAARSPADHPVVLSGDVDGDDNTNANGVTPTAGYVNGNNSRHVLIFDGGDRIGADVAADITGATVLDGVSVTGGQADGSAEDGAGLFCDGQGSGNECSPTLANLIFAGNNATRDGAALYLDGSDEGVANPAITNVLFTGNAADNFGGAIYLGPYQTGAANPTLTNVTIVGNSANSGGAIFNNDLSGLSADAPRLENTLIWGNTITSESGEVVLDAGNLRYRYSLVEGKDPDGPGNQGHPNLDGTDPANDPLFFNTSDPDGPDNTFATDDDGLRLRDGSPALNAGNNAFIPSSMTTDLAGSERIGGGTVDLGAFEGALSIKADQHAITFDGTDDKLEISDADVFDDLSEMTVEAWVYFSSSGRQGIMEKHDSPDSGWWIDFNTDITALMATGDGDRAVSTSAEPELNRWHHVAVTYDGTDVTVFLNGSISGQSDYGTTGGAITNNTRSINIGDLNWTGAPLGGKVDELRIWSTARSQQQIQNKMFQALGGDETNLIGYWPLDEGTGTTGFDKTANTNDAALTNGPTWSGDTHPYGTVITGTEGWRMMSSPLDGASYNILLDELWTQGFFGADVSHGTPNVQTWDEAAGSWSGIDDGSVAPGKGNGFITYVYADEDPNTAGTQEDFPKMITVDQTQAEGTVSPKLSYTDTGSPADDGWNLVGNPYGATIDWNASSGWSRSNMDGVVYVWSDTAGGGSGSYLSWNGSTGTLSDGLIAPWQGFWVKANSSNPEILINDEARSSGATFYKEQEVPEIEFQVTDSSQGAKTIVTFLENARKKKDSLDAWQLKSLNQNYLALYTSLENGAGLDINALPLHLSRTHTVNLDIAGNSLNGEYELSWSVQKIPEGWNFMVKDRQTGKEILLNEIDSYKFSMNGTEDHSNQRSEKVEDPGRMQPNVFSSDNFSMQRFKMIIAPHGVALPLESVDEQPEELELKPNYPNPFNPKTVIRYGVPEQQHIQLSVYNVMGRKVQTLIHGTKSAGRYKVNFNASNLASGVYLYQLIAGQKVLIRKMLLVK